MCLIASFTSRGTVVTPAIGSAYSAGPGGGIFAMPGAPTAWLPYIGVDDLKTATDKAASLGAKVIMREQEVPGHGWFSVLVDPTGANIALWQAK